MDIIKLDIEGMEGEAISEAHDALSSVSEVLIEYHPNMNKKQNDINTINAILAKNCFTVTIANTKSFFSRKSDLKIIHAIRYKKLYT